VATRSLGPSVVVGSEVPVLVGVVVVVVVVVGVVVVAVGVVVVVVGVVVCSSEVVPSVCPSIVKRRVENTTSDSKYVCIFIMTR